MAQVLEPHVRETDAFTVSLERDPLLRSTVVAAALFEGTPAWDVLTDRIERATRLTPTFRERLVSSPLGLAPPRWVLDPDFDPTYHLRRVAAPAPGDLESVLDLARAAGMTAFDPARPRWEMTLVEGLAGDRSALVMKLHHALTDGIGGLQIAAHVVDFGPEPTDLGPLPPAPMAPPHGPLDPLADALRYDLARVAGAVAGGVRALPAQVARTVRDPVGAVTGAVRTTAALGRFTRPITSTRSPVMTGRRLIWRYDILDIPLEPLRAAAATVGGTVNDGFLGGITGGMRRYHLAHGAPVDELRLTMPVSLRTEDDPEGGNRITLVRLEVPVGLEDPAARMEEIDRRCRARRDDPALPWSNTVAGVLNLLPRTVTGGMLKHVDFLASNVPGFPDPVWVGGAPLVGFHAFGPTLGSAANITLMSYRDTCHLGITTDAGAIPDPEVFVTCLRAGFDEVLTLAGPGGSP